MEIKTLDKRLETDSISELLTQGEAGVDKFQIRIPRYYYGTDLSGFTFRLRGISDKLTIAEAFLTGIPDEDDILLEWLVTPEFTAVSGKLKLELSIISPDQSQVLKLTSRDIKIRESLWGAVPPESITTFEKSLSDISDLQKNSLLKDQLRAGRGVIITRADENVIISFSGAVDDESPSFFTTYSSQKLEEEFLHRGETPDASASKSYVDEELEKKLSYSEYDPLKTGTVTTAFRLLPVSISPEAGGALSDFNSEGEYVCEDDGENGFTDKPWEASDFRLSVKCIKDGELIRQVFTGFEESADKCPYVRYIRKNLDSEEWNASEWKPWYDGFRVPTPEELQVLPLSAIGREAGQIPVIGEEALEAPRKISLHNPEKEAVPMPYTAQLSAEANGSLIISITDSSTEEHKLAGYFRLSADGKYSFYDAGSKAVKYFYSELNKPYVTGSYTGGSGTQPLTVNLGFQPSVVMVDGDFVIRTETVTSANEITITNSGFRISGTKIKADPNPHTYIAFR